MKKIKSHKWWRKGTGKKIRSLWGGEKKVKAISMERFHLGFQKFCSKLIGLKVGMKLKPSSLGSFFFPFLFSYLSMSLFIPPFFTAKKFSRLQTTVRGVIDWSLTRILDCIDLISKDKTITNGIFAFLVC